MPLYGPVYLSAHFTLEEMVASQTASRQGIDNTPSPEIVENLKATAQYLELVRGFLGCPVVISSGYRCPELNAAVGGVPTSAHLTGFAADFNVPMIGSPFEVARRIWSGMTTLTFDQLLVEYGAWVHIAFNGNRRQVATIDRSGFREGLHWRD